MRSNRAVLLCVAMTALSLCIAPADSLAGPVQMDVPVFEALEPAADPGETGLSARKARLHEDVRAAKVARLAAAKPPKPELVDCSQGKSLQEAIDKSEGPAVIEVRGLCPENIVINRRDDLTLRGLDPMTDGITGDPDGVDALAAVRIAYSENITIENLSISSPTAMGLAAHHSRVTAQSCSMSGSASTGIHVSTASYFTGVGLTLTGNGRDALVVQRGSTGLCIGCSVANNSRYAGVANQGGVLSYVLSVIEGPRGIYAIDGSYADVDCVTWAELYPEYPDCSLHVQRWAALASMSGEAVLYAAGGFSGSLLADSGGTVLLNGAQQLVVPDAPYNQFYDFARLETTPYYDENGTPHESAVTLRTEMAGFSRALLTGATVLDANLECYSAADAWAEPGVVVTPGNSITGCEHVPAP